MSSVFHRLIKLGEVDPGLRPDLFPVLRRLEKIARGLEFVTVHELRGSIVEVMRDEGLPATYEKTGPGSKTILRADTEKGELKLELTDIQPIDSRLNFDYSIDFKSSGYLTPLSQGSSYIAPSGLGESFLNDLLRAIEYVKRDKSRAASRRC